MGSRCGCLLGLMLAFACLLMLAGCGGSSSSPAPVTPGSGSAAPQTLTPIQHVIIVIGENHSFDNVFGTYQPTAGNQVWNLVSEKIVNPDGSPGPNFPQGLQQQATDTDYYRNSPMATMPYAALPQPNTGENSLPLSWYQLGVTHDPGLAAGDQPLLMNGGLLNLNPPEFPFLADGRFSAALPSGPFPITQYAGYNQTVGDPVHRFFQMWQQVDCNSGNSSSTNPSGCMHDLYPWVGVTVGWGQANIPPPQQFTDETTFQGAVSMGFYNMAAGDWPYVASLANTYTLSDNYHQPMLGGTGTNSAYIGTAAPLVYSDEFGNPANPPMYQVESPDPYPASNNWYQNDGFYFLNPGHESNAAYVNCSDMTQPGVKAIQTYLNSLPYQPFNHGNCAPNTYYLVNNQVPAYDRTGTVMSDQLHSVGPSAVPTIGDALSAANVSWKYYADGFDYSLGNVADHYCDICNPFQYAHSIMTTDLKNNIQDIANFFSDVQGGTLPAVSFIKPDDVVDSHPGTSLPALFDAFVKNVVQTVQSSSAWPNTAIFITWDESGGYYDSGYIQPIDYFGDGPRIPLLVVSPYSQRNGYVDHTYTDHASLLKFIEKNWGLQPLSATSRDNLPNPTSDSAAPYFPTNSPAIGDLTTAFQFPQ